MSPYGWYQLARVQHDLGRVKETQKILDHLATFEPNVARQLRARDRSAHRRPVVNNPAVARPVPTARHRSPDLHRNVAQLNHSAILARKSPAPHGDLAGLDTTSTTTTRGPTRGSGLM